MSGEPEKSEGKSESKASNTFDQYEYVSVIAPGAALLMGLVYLFPNLRETIGGGDTGLAELGLLLIAAFIVGHLVAGIGELIEALMWRRHGMPTDWVTQPPRDIIGQEQRVRLRELIMARFPKVDIDNLDRTDSEQELKWKSITRQIYAAVRAAGRNYRIDAFNRTYGFCRNFSAAALVLLLIVLFYRELPFRFERVVGVLAIAFIIAVVRAYVFGKTYGRELFVTYIDLMDTPAAPVTPAIVTTPAASAAPDSAQKPAG